MGRWLSLCCKPKIAAPLMCEIPNKDTENLKLLPCLSVAKRGYASKRWPGETIWCTLYRPKPICRCPITSAFAWCSLRWLWAACAATACAGGCKDTSIPSPLPFARVRGIICVVLFSVRILTLWVPFCSPTVHLAAKNRFSRRLLLMQKGVSLWIQQNEFLFKGTVICTMF